MMATEARSTAGSAFRLERAWPLLAGFAALAIPTAISLASQEWTQESGAHEPIVLGVGGWLIWREAPRLAGIARPGGTLVTLSLMGVSLLLYVFGRAYDFATLEGVGLYGVGIAMLHSRLGAAAITRVWFPLLFLGLAVPPPHALLDAITAPLKHFVSYAATSGLAALGLPVARQGVTIFVAQYQLLVEDACSGVNSLEGLVAVTLLYVYLMRGQSVGWSVLMACFAIPIAIIANIVRVTLLVWVTYQFGDAAAQGLLHFTTGIVLFATALLLVFALDKALGQVLRLRTQGIGRAPT